MPTRNESSTRKLARIVQVLIHAALALVAFAIIALPASAADHQLQPLQVSSTGILVGSAAPGDTSAPHQPNATCPPNGQCFTDVLPSSPFYTFTNRIYQQNLVSGYPCGGPGEPCDAENRPYYRPDNNVTRQQMAKFIDNSRRLPQIHMETASPDAAIYVSNTVGDGIDALTYTSTALYGRANGGGIGVYGQSLSFGVYGTSEGGYGVWGASTTGTGVVGTSTNGDALYGSSATGTGVHGYSGATSGVGVLGVENTGAGVEGSSTSGWGVYGLSASNYGVFGASTSSDGVHGISNTGTGVTGLNGTGGVGVTGNGGAEGVYGQSPDGFGVFGFSPTGTGVEGDTTTGAAGFFHGNVTVTGTCTGCVGPSKVDDPLDPANKYLYQSPVQSDDMMDIYNGNVTTDDKGEATVQLPDYFQALNRDFRYQLTPIGQFAQAIVWQEIKDNEFVIKTDKPNVKVSWQVTGTRHDAFANAHSTPAEVEKPAGEQGLYLHPELYGQPPSKGVDYNKRAQPGK